MVDRDAQAPYLGDDAIGAYNRFVLQPEVAYARLAPRGPGPGRTAGRGRTQQVIDEPPAETPSLDGELAALALATRAAWHLERAETRVAMALLNRAAQAAQCRPHRAVRGGAVG